MTEYTIIGNYSGELDAVVISEQIRHKKSKSVNKLIRHATCDTCKTWFKTSKVITWLAANVT